MPQLPTVFNGAVTHALRVHYGYYKQWTNMMCCKKTLQVAMLLLLLLLQQLLLQMRALL
jgi:hypothetical protein